MLCWLQCHIMTKNKENNKTRGEAKDYAHEHDLYLTLILEIESESYGTCPVETG